MTTRDEVQTLKKLKRLMGYAYRGLRLAPLVPTRTSHAYASVYFHHIGKTGGTSLDSALRDHFGILRSFPHRGVTSRLLTHARRYSYFAGHMPWEVQELLPSPCLVVTTLRSPVEHFVSSYKHLARAGTDHILLSGRSKPLASLDDYLSDEELSPWTFNPQTFSVGRQLNWLEFLRNADRTESVDWSADAGSTSTAFYFLYGRRQDDRSDAGILERAKARLTRPNTVAFPTEEIDSEFSLVYRLATGSRHAPPPPRINRAPRAQALELTDAQLSEIRMRTKLDQQLYDFVCARVSDGRSPRA